MWPLFLIFLNIVFASATPLKETKELYLYTPESAESNFRRINSTYIGQDCLECFTFDGVRFFQKGHQLKHFLEISCNRASSKELFFVREETCDALAELLDPNFDGEIISEELATQLMRFMLYRLDITFEYFEDGCFARNVAMREVYTSLGIKTLSFLIKADGEERLTTSTPYGDARWLWHVAPSVMARARDGSVRRMILDPGLSHHPMTADEFSGSLGFSYCPSSTGWEDFLISGTTCRTYLEVEDRFYDMLLFLSGSVRYYVYLERAEKIEKAKEFMSRDNITSLVRSRRMSVPRVDPINNTEI